MSSTGQLGVGTATPNYSIDVQASGGAGVAVRDTASNYTYSVGAFGDDWYLSQSSPGSGYTVMSFNAANQLLSQQATVYVEYGLKVGFIKVMGSTTLTNLNHVVLVDSTNSAVTVTLPSAGVMLGRVLTIKHTAGANAVTVVGATGTETIDGASLSLTTANATRTVICDGAKWFVIGN